MAFEKIKYKYGFDFYKNHDAVPIEEMARALGIDVYPAGNGQYKMKCPCPNHDDEHPSTQITTTGKYENTFKCWSCGEWGGPLELVMAVKYGVVPSEFREINKTGFKEQKKEMYVYRDESAKFIDTIFKGGISIQNGKEDASVIPQPIIPKWIEEGLGLERYPYAKKFVTVDVNEGQTKKEEYEVEPSTIAYMIIDKLFEFKQKLKDNQFEIFKNYPGLDAKAKVYIMLETDNKIDEVDKFTEVYKQYAEYLADKDAAKNVPFWEDGEEIVLDTPDEVTTDIKDFTIDNINIEEFER